MIDTQIHTERRAHTIVLLLAASVGLMMTGYGIVMPVFARRLGLVICDAAVVYFAYRVKTKAAS